MVAVYHPLSRPSVAAVKIEPKNGRPGAGRDEKPSQTKRNNYIYKAEKNEVFSLTIFQGRKYGRTENEACRDEENACHHQ